MIRKPYENNGRFTLNTGSQSVVQQQHRNECEINNIISKYRRSGLLSHVAQFQGKYGDVSQIGDYQDCLSKVNQANDMFGSLPANVRKKFHNNPAEFLDFALNPENSQGLIDLGLAKKVEPEPAPTPDPEPEPKP